MLSHPNIVKVLDVGFNEDVRFIVMEYIDGITLKDYIEREKKLTWKEASHLIVQILRALQHAHDRGIIHRDIKPQNIICKLCNVSFLRVEWCYIQSDLIVLIDSKIYWGILK